MRTYEDKASFEFTLTEQKFLTLMLQLQEEFYKNYPKDEYEKVKINHRITNDLLYKLMEKSL